jgi:lysophospholipase L1-like esterase
MNNKEIKITFFGDSICVGAGVSVHEGWVSLVSQRLQKKFPSLVVANSSVNGRTTRQALENMPYEIQSTAPDILIVQFGMNDCNYWKTDGGLPRVSLGSFKSNLNEIFDRAFYCGVKKICVNTNHPTCRTKSKMPFTDIVYQDNNEKYNEVIRELHRERSDSSIVLNDIEKHFKNSTLEMEQYVLGEPDLLHLSNAGHLEYYNFIYPKIEEVVTSVSQND